MVAVGLLVLEIGLNMYGGKRLPQRRGSLLVSLTDYNCFGVHLLSRHHESLAGVAYSWRCQLCWRERASASNRLD